MAPQGALGQRPTSPLLQGTLELAPGSQTPSLRGGAGRRVPADLAPAGPASSGKHGSAFCFQKLGSPGLGLELAKAARGRPSPDLLCTATVLGPGHSPPPSGAGTEVSFGVRAASSLTYTPGPAAGGIDQVEDRQGPWAASQHCGTLGRKARLSEAGRVCGVQFSAKNRDSSRLNSEILLPSHRCPATGHPPGGPEHGHVS